MSDILKINASVTSESDVMIPDDEVFSALESTMQNLRECDGAFHLVAVWEDHQNGCIHHRTVGFNGMTESTGAIHHHVIALDKQQDEGCTLHDVFSAFSNALCVSSNSKAIVGSDPSGDGISTILVVD